MTLMEAMASGKPVVATKVGGNSELIIDGVTGFLVPVHSTDKMAEAIIKLLENDKMRRSMGKEAKKRIEQRFDINDVVRQHESLYLDLAEKRGIA